MKQWETRGLNWVLLSFCATLHHGQHISCNKLVFKSLPMLCAIAIVTERTHKRNRFQYFNTALKELEPTVPNFPEGFNLGTGDTGPIILPLRNNSVIGIHFYSVINFYPSDVWSFLSCGNPDVADGTTTSTGYKSPLLRSVTDAWNQEHLKIFRSGINCPRPNHGGQLANARWVGSFCGHELNFPVLLSYTIYASKILKFIRISEKSLVPAKGHFPQSAFFLPFKKLSWCLFPSAPLLSVSATCSSRNTFRCAVSLWFL